jgi:hypothetical protein
LLHHKFVAVSFFTFQHMHSLKSFCHDLGLNLSQMAQWLGINRSSLSRYKRPGNNRQRSANLKVLDAFITEWQRISTANESPASLRQTD